ncbi:preprotein translocase subunit SecG [Duganella sp. FT80W]|uniref:Protein-export membrane protein SecG n=1 Tax=Duganella guangzhouensis TaxID=2666084 RepID=A0A6I2KTM1_9BURK|nr:preprotein translocase subunit SecG [Duganella guangzhouensis]MRW88971.1 preprotein translocase subunit SecG [Duganella guangzhouensis]
MGTFFNLVIVVQVISAISIIGLVLLQHGKGADMGAAFGSGASGSLFGATGSSNFMSKSTGVAAVIFFSATLALSYITTHQISSVSGGVMDKVPAAAPAPAAPAAAAPVAPAAASAEGSSAPVAPAASAPANVPPANSIPK